MGPIFSTTGMTAMSVAVFAAEVLSLAILAVLVASFRHIRRSQRALIDALIVSVDPRSDDAAKLRRSWSEHEIMLWVYIITTFVLVFVTAGIFLFQPHVL